MLGDEEPVFVPLQGLQTQSVQEFSEIFRHSESIG